MRSLDLADLDAFVAIARHRSFRQAARERGVAASTLSQALRTLEERLGVRLLNRTTRSVALTDAGADLLARLVPALAEVNEAVDRVNRYRDTVSGSLRINAPTAVVELLLAPMIAEFMTEHPRLSVEIVAEDAFVDVVERGFDAGVRFEESIARDMIAVPLGPPQRLIVVAAPSYIAARGRPETPNDLLQHACIRRRFPNGSTLPWEFEKDGQTVRVVVDGPLVTTNTHLALTAAERGIGLARTFELFTTKTQAEGRLVGVLDDWCPPFSGPFLYYPSRRHVPAGLRAFIDFLRRRRPAATQAAAKRR
jgi:DNA-binding transcriptional LysR family regulator